MSTLIAPKPFSEYSAEEYHAYVSSMYALRTKGSRKAASPAPGLSVSRTKRGALSIRRSKTGRAFDYVTMPELVALAKAVPCGQADLWNAFKERKFIITQTRLEAEHTYTKLIAKEQSETN